MASGALIDTHAHLDFEDFDSDRHELVAAMQQQNIRLCVIPGVSPERWSSQMAIAAEFNYPFGLGVHPWWANNNWQRQRELLERQLTALSAEPRLVALGECGLDKYRADNWAWQLPLLEAQLDLASKFNLPLILHCVRAHDELIERLQSVSLPRKGVIHGFYGSVELARRYQALGFKLGIGGLLLDDNAKKLRQVVTELPLECFVCETDSPAMAPKNSLSRRNTPLILGDIVQKIAILQTEPYVLVSEQLLANAIQLFEI